MSAGQDFVKKIGPFGSALFLLLFIGFILYAILSPAKPVQAPEEAPPVESEVYEANPVVF